MDSAGNVTGVVKQHVFVAFNDSHLADRSGAPQPNPCLPMIQDERILEGAYSTETTQTSALRK